MTVAVLNPQDCLKDNRFSKFPKETLISSPQMKFPKHAYNPNRTVNRAHANRRKRSPPPPRPQSRAAAAGPPQKTSAKTNLVMGQVKILKRGEELTSTAPFQAPPVKKSVEKKGQSQIQDPDLGSTERLGPDPESSRVGVASFYAGSACITSPPPSSLPLPAFFTKKTVTVKNDDATTDLRRILKLDLL
ncbi:hypothetical protein CISIN_1g029061mg [Citrus sinensis]|uniref:Uncharacterized protein n=1 Tax=Citrus sinensis TaxID=2711 RepID=A0A067DVE5_CITSI|nr:hypothetical protein CISIN_1g029061mg [Citrus sinensis]